MTQALNEKGKRRRKGNTLPAKARPELSAPSPSRIRSRLLKWFAIHKRDLPWRTEPRDPYHVWLSEVMLQQTQVATVIPYYRRWLQRFPSLKALASAPIDDVLKVWEGLGYYSRARNFHRAAQHVVHERSGQIPDTVEGLLALPGVGRYTAGAIASLAFGRDAPILDGNVKRVLGRLYAIADVQSPRATHALWQLSESLLPKGRAGEFNEALMDLGATICTPRAPACPACPIRSDCIAFARGNPEAYPARIKRPNVPHKVAVTAVIEDTDGRVLMAQRPLSGLLGGLWEFPGGEMEQPEDGDAAAQARHLARLVRSKTGVRIRVTPGNFIGEVTHGFTHLRLTRHVAYVRLAGRGPELVTGGFYPAARWVTAEEMSQLALTRSDQKIRDLAFGPSPRPLRLL